MKFARVVFATLVVALLALGCSGEDEPEETNGEERYCAAYRDFFDERAAQNMSTSDAEVVATLKKWGVQLTEIGAPESMSQDARAGHEIWSDLIGKVEDDANEADVVAMEEKLSEKQRSQVEEFFTFNDSTCLGSRGSVSGEESS